ncbi:hypothetical protein [Luteibacter sp.]|uniref:hypothetical protein n=1 Tax=Luteibacter sp. TaxID=1886636 RepID=UPI003F80C9C1
MNIVLGFLPFIVFAIASALGYTVAGLVAAALIAGGMLAWDKIVTHRVKLLDVGTTVLFAALAIYAMASGEALSLGLVRLCVDVGLLVIILISVMVGRPFTIDYARQKVARELWSTPRFLRTNQVISLVWAGAFALFALIDILLWRHLATPGHIVLMNAAVLYAAIKFTAWYPAHVRKQAATPS